MGENPTNDGTVRAISLFSGLGGLDIGLHRAGIETLVCVEQDETAVQTLKINSREYDTAPPETTISVPARYPWQVINADIRTVSADEILEAAGVEPTDIDLVVGGPPCQTFSRSNEGNRSGTDTKRGKLFQEFARILHAISPPAFLFENVRGLESSNGGRDLREIRAQLEGDTYTTEYRVLNTADYGVPQTRQRVIIIGIKEGTPAFPEPTHSERGVDGTDRWVTVEEALAEFDLDQRIEDTGGYRNAIGSRYGPLLREIPEGANYQHFSERRYDPDQDEYVPRTESELDEKRFEWRSRHWNYLLKMDRRRPSWTVQAAPGTTVGPFHWRARKLSLLEQMKLMDLPLDYYVAGHPGQIQSQVGNAVPPRLAHAVARSLMTALGRDLSPPARHRSSPRASDSLPAGQPPFTVEVTTERSPWHYADKILHAVLTEAAVLVRAEARAIPYGLDAIEIARRQTEREMAVTIDESVVEGDSWKGGCASVLQATVVSEDASVDLTRPSLAP